MELSGKAKEKFEDYLYGVKGICGLHIRIASGSFIED